MNEEIKEQAREKLNKSYLRLAYGKSDIETTKQEVNKILDSLELYFLISSAVFLTLWSINLIVNSKE